MQTFEEICERYNVDPNDVVYYFVLSDGSPRLIMRDDFNEVYSCLLDDESDVRLIYGGRGSGKSSDESKRCVASTFSGHNWLVVRYYKLDLRNSCFNEITSVIYDWGLENEFTIEGVLALMCDSTNAERPGFTPSEKTVGRTFDNLFEEHKNTRIFVATFASNVDRVQQIINSAYKFGRKVAVEGRSMVNVIETAINLGCITIPENTLVDLDLLKGVPAERQVIITTGSQGESMAALSRMASGMHRKLSIGAGDTVIFSSSPIPGNEKSVTKIINELQRKGADVIFQDVHVSGHACQEEIKLIYTLVQPKYAIPVHGEYKHLKAQARIAESLGIDKKNIFMLTTGDVLELDDEGAAVTDKVVTGGILVDGLGVGDVGNVVLRDRQHLSEEGIMIVVMALTKETGELLSGPEIMSRGFVYVRESDELIEEARLIVDEAVQACLDRGITDWVNIR